MLTAITSGHEFLAYSFGIVAQVLLLVTLPLPY